MSAPDSPLSLPFVPVCQMEDLPLGLGRAFQLGKRTLAVFRTRGNRVFAFENSCPHKGGPLADGMLADGNVVCPMHSFRFEPGTGGCDQEKVCSVATYPVEVTNGVVRVGYSPDGQS